MLKVKICKYCSQLDEKKVKKCMKKYDCKLKVGCFGHCLKKEPDLAGKSYGRIGKKLKVVSSQEEFLKKLKKHLKKEAK